MIHLFDNNYYFIIMLILILMILIYGGPKKSNNFQIEYDISKFKYLHNLNIFENYSEQLNISNDIQFENITGKNKFFNYLIPNLIEIFYIKINPNQIVNIKKHLTNKNKDKNEDNLTSIMIIYYHNNNTKPNNNGLKLLLDVENICNKENVCNNIGSLYNIDKKISILDIYPIYNDSIYNEIITCYIIKKPFWFF